MIIETAKSGRGSHSIVINNTNQLSGLVVSALQKAFEPSLKGCTITMQDKEEKLDEVFRNQTVFKTAIMSKSEFNDFSFKFHCDEDPTTMQSIDLEFSSDKFRLVEKESLVNAMFKMAAY